MIPDYAMTALKLLHNSGFEGFLVGGCVRDLQMGAVPHDYDLTTNARPEEMQRVFADYRQVDTGLKHGTLIVVIDGANVEVTTYRVDGEYTDNRHPKQVTFTADLAGDLARRDFTVNAMAYAPEKGLVDLFGGRENLGKRIIRCVGDPDTRFGEDSLRILRALRFASVLDFSVDPKTAESIHKNRDLLRNISVERIYAELVKLLCGAGAERILLDFADVICTCIPELQDTVGFAQNNPYHCYDVYTHSVKAVAAAPREKQIRLALLLHDSGKPACYSEDARGGHFYGHHNVSAEITEQVLRRFHADNRTIKTVSKLVHDHDREIQPTEKAVRRVLTEYSPELFAALIAVKRADNLAQVESVRSRQSDLDRLEEIATALQAQEGRLSLKALQVSGDDLLALGFTPGKALGNALQTLLSMVMDGDLPNEKAALLDAAQTMLS